MRAESNRFALHLADLALVEQWLLPLVHIPRVCLADEARYEKYRGAEAVPSQYRPGCIVRGPVTVVERDDNRPVGKSGPFLLVRYPLIESDGLVVPAF